MKTYRLISTDMVNTPGLVLWAVRGMGHRQAKKFLGLAFPNLPGKALDRLVREEYMVEGDMVIVEVPHSSTRKCLGPCVQCGTIPLGKLSQDLDFKKENARMKSQDELL